MTTEEIKTIGKTLARRRMKSKLWLQLRIERPTLAWGTLNRAFGDIAVDVDSELLPWIQEEGRKMIEADDLRIAQEKANQLDTAVANSPTVVNNNLRPEIEKGLAIAMA